MHADRSRPKRHDHRSGDGNVEPLCQDLLQPLRIIKLGRRDSLDDLDIRQPHLRQRSLALVEALQLYTVLVFQNCAIARIKRADAIQITLTQLEALECRSPWAAAGDDAFNNIF